MVGIHSIVGLMVDNHRKPALTMVARRKKTFNALEKLPSLKSHVSGQIIDQTMERLRLGFWCYNFFQADPSTGVPCLRANGEKGGDR